MRLHVSLFAVVAVVVAGSAGAASSGKPALVRIVKRDGNVTATLAYVKSGRGGLFLLHPTLSIRRDGRLLLRRTMCPRIAAVSLPCAWENSAELAFLRVAGPRPSVVLHLFTGGNTCCAATFVAVLGPNPRWISHTFSSEFHRGRRIHGRYYFVSMDGRFYGAFTTPPGSDDPIQIWTIRAGRFVDATRSLRGLVRIDARRAKRYLRLSHHLVAEGTLAAWCADEYLLGRGPTCVHAVHYDLAHGYLRADKGGQMRGRAFVHELNRDLTRWGYKHRR